ncbi:MAG: hypothetical protein U9R25_01730, partial [Chloroflexota bacterium]|nr:hypothetical protein [Chloroflexota bacterium]
TNPTDYIDFDPVNKRIISSDYGLGWATAASVPPGQGQHNGLDYMSLFGGPDILDRTKIRIDYRFIILIQLTEEWFPPNDIELVKDGPVRVLVKRGPTTTEGYRSFVRTAFPIDLSSLPGTLEHVRTSADLVEGVTGTYYDENNAGGVAIDGVPDSVQPTPFNQAWRQVTVGDGSNIQMASLDELGGTPYHYYQDDSTGDGDDTGDLRSFGDSGFGVTNPGSENFSLVTGQFFIPASEGNQGATYYEYFQDPLEVSAVPVRQYKTYLPLQIKE